MDPFLKYRSEPGRRAHLFWEVESRRRRPPAGPKTEMGGEIAPRANAEIYCTVAAEGSTHAFILGVNACIHLAHGKRHKQLTTTLSRRSKEEKAKLCRPTMSNSSTNPDNNAAEDASSSVPNNGESNGSNSAPETVPKKRGPTYYYAIRKCAGLDGPAIFLKESDASRFLAEDKAAIHRRFTDADDADAWIRGKKKVSRKRKAVDDGNAAKSKVLKDVIEKNDQLWEQKFEELKTFTETDGDGDPNLAMQKEYRKPQLQAWLSGQRRNYNRYINNEVNEARSQFDRKERFYKLLELGVRLKAEETTGSWKEWAQRWRDYTLDNPSVPLTAAANTRDDKAAELAEWQNRQIVEYVKMMRKEQPHEMYPHRVKQLGEWDFPFPRDIQPPKKALKTFDERVQEFLDWKEEHGSPMVPQSLDGLGEWVKEQRKEYRKKIAGKKTCMSDERLAKLNAAGFIFRIRTPRKQSLGGDAGPQPEPPVLQLPPLPPPQIQQMQPASSTAAVDPTEV